MSQERTYKRQVLNFSVNRDMQLRMIGRMSGIILVCLLLSSSIYFYHANQEITASFELFHIKARNFLDFLLPVVSISFVLSLLAGTIASLFFPKNLAGPLFRIERDVRRIGKGDLTVRINLRKGDEGSALAGQINQLTYLFRGTFGGIQDSLSQAREICSQAKMTPAERLEELQAIHDRIAGQIKAFKVA